MPRWLRYLLGALLLGGAAYAVTRPRRSEDQAELDADEDSLPGASLTRAQLHLAPVADAAAAALEREFPGQIIFTSGRRSWTKQAQLEVRNGGKVAANFNEKNPDAPPMSLLQGLVDYITQTHSDSPVKAAVLQALSGQYDGASAADLVAALVDVFKGFTDAELSHYSKHPAGYAFDFILAVALLPRAWAVLKRVPGFQRKLDDEDGLKVNHAQFVEPVALAGLLEAA